jgi:hypothetical protein
MPLLTCGSSSAEPFGRGDCYPCIKKAWVEYLGEHPEPAIDRVE